MQILVASCRSYSDCWKPFSALFNKFWSDCEHPRHLFSSRPDDPSDIPEDFPCKWIDDRGWCINLLRALESCDDEVALILQEDFFICDPVRGPVISEIATWLPESGFDCARLYPCPGALGRDIGPGLGVIDIGEDYRLSLQAALWKRNSCIEILQKVIKHSDGTARDFELIGQRFIDHMHICGWRREDKHLWPLQYHSTAVVNGSFLQGALDLCALNGIPVKPGRPVMQ